MEASAALHHQAPTLPERAPASARARTPPPLRPPPEKRARAPAQPAQALRCPRCDSANTKFCYYNNYSLAQPRYFCKGCRRYWTHGGSLRNVPVGGGNRKNKKPPASASGRRPPLYNSAAGAAAAAVAGDLTAAPVPLALPPGLLEFLGSGSLGSGYRGPCGDAEVPLLPFGEVGGGLQYWQVGGAEAAGLEAVDGGRELWGYAGSDWHGLINGALLQ